MSRRSSSPKPDSMLNLTPPRVAPNHQVGSPNVSVSSPEMFPESSCLSSEPENNYEDSTSTAEYGGSRPEITPMLLVGCPRCFMYVMLSEVDPKCPQCKSTVFLDFLNQENAKWARN